MNDLKQRLYDLSVKWEQIPIDNDLNIPSEIFKEVAVFEYLKMKNSDELILKGAEDDVVESIISETFGTYGKYIASKQRATVDYKIFKDEYIHFWHSIQKNKFKGEKINLLKDIICKSEFLVGNEDYGYYDWTYKSSEHLLSLCAKDLETHYWHNPRILRSLVPFYIILFALILAKDIENDSPLIIHQQALKNYKTNMNLDMASALDWIVTCCAELYLDNEQHLLFKDKITISGITEFLEHFNYSKYFIKQQFYTLLKVLYGSTLYFDNSTDLLTELRCLSFIEQIHSLFKGNNHKWKLVSKWLNTPDEEQAALGYMSSDYRMIKKYLCQYFEIFNKAINISRDFFETDSDLFTYSPEDCPQNDSDVLKMINEKFSKTDSNYLFSVILLALNAPLDNHLSYISYAEICDEIIHTLPNLKNSDCYKDCNGHSAGIYYLLDTVIGEKMFLLQTNKLSSEIINRFKYIFENPEEIFSKKFIGKSAFWLNKSFEKVLTEIYLNTILSFKTGG